MDESLQKKINVVIVDDSIKTRSLLRTLLSQNPLLEIVGEGVNGIEALEMIWEKKPDVILMEMEMPLMDGMTALQHLMIHLPTPTILFSRLTEDGSLRSFDAIKNGAVDFIGKERLALIGNDISINAIFTDRIVRAAQLKIEPLEPIFPSMMKTRGKRKMIRTLVFCEECGAKTELVIPENEDQGEVLCSKCKEYIPVLRHHRYRKANFLTVLIGGEGSCSNLLKIVPELPQDINGTLLVLLKGERRHIHEFSDYLNAMSTINVLEVTSGLPFQGGNCYIAALEDVPALLACNKYFEFQCAQQPTQSASGSPLLSVGSFFQVFKKNMLLAMISGVDKSIVEILPDIKKNKVNIVALHASKCLYSDGIKESCGNICNGVFYDEESLAAYITSIHSNFRDSIVLS